MDKTLIVLTIRHIWKFFLVLFVILPTCYWLIFTYEFVHAFCIIGSTQGGYTDLLNGMQYVPEYTWTLDIAVNWARSAVFSFFGFLYVLSILFFYFTVKELKK